MRARYPTSESADYEHAGAAASGFGPAGSVVEHYRLVGIKGSPLWDCGAERENSLTLRSALVVFARFFRERGGPMVVQIAKFDAALGLFSLWRRANRLSSGSANGVDEKH